MITRRGFLGALAGLFGMNIPESISRLSPRQKYLLASAQRKEVLASYWLNPHLLLPFPSEPWQRLVMSDALSREQNVTVVAPRGAGKSELIGRVAYVEACLGGYVLVVSPSDRQSIKFFHHVRRTHRDFNLVQGESDPTKHEMFLQSGGKVEAVPSKEETLRSIHNVTLLVLDEASRIKDELYGAVLPMLAPGGRVVSISTPNGTRGFFHHEWIGKGRQDWAKHLISWRQCPWITPETVENYNRSNGDLMTRQEFGCEFLSLSNCPFDIDAMMRVERAEYEPTWS